MSHFLVSIDLSKMEKFCFEILEKKIIYRWSEKHGLSDLS